LKNSVLNNSCAKIILGTWLMGGDVKPNQNNDDRKDIEAIKYAINKGILHIDTSESYAGGKTERLIGEAIKEFSRDKVFIATKVREYNLSYDNVINSCKESIKRLNTSYIDLYYIHKQNPSIPIEETASALNKLLELGIIKHVGLSNVGIKTIKKYSEILNVPIFAVQNQYNLVCRESQIKGVINYCRENSIHFIAWRPILLSYPGSIDPYYHTGTYKVLDEIANKYKKTNVQIAVKWLLQQNGVSIAFKSTNKEHIDEILEVETFELSDEDWEKLNKDFPVQKEFGCTANTYFELS
jgi:diketogulonate reductase-like aldo/keto reductase